QFFKSPRGQQLANARAVHREIDFLLSWPPGQPNTTGRYIQGVIDCLYQDREDNWHILDFKTNDVTATNIAQEAQQYELQLQVYAIALEHTLKTSPKELALHFLRPGAEHIIQWNDTARTRAITKMNSLITESLTTTDGLVASATS